MKTFFTDGDGVAQGVRLLVVEDEGINCKIIRRLTGTIPAADVQFYHDGDAPVGAGVAAVARCTASGQYRCVFCVCSHSSSGWVRRRDDTS